MRLLGIKSMSEFQGKGRIFDLELFLYQCLDKSETYISSAFVYVGLNSVQCIT